MSLVVEVKINSTLLRTIEVTRQTPHVHVSPLGKARYQVTVFDHEAHTERRLEGALVHTPGKGALALAAAALEKVEQHSPRYVP